MSFLRNLLISIGAFWLSRQLVVLTTLLVGKIEPSMTYGDSILSAIAMGVIGSMGRAVCAAFGAVIVVLTVPSAKPQRWAWIVALLYAVAGQPRFYWHRPPTTWDRMSQTANIMWPTVVCVAAAMLFARWTRDSVASNRDAVINPSS